MGNPSDAPMISWDTWGLIATGVVILVLWLAFRRIFAEKPSAAPDATPKDKPGDEPKP